MALIFENLVNGSEHHTSNRNNRAFVTTAFFDRKITVTDFWVLF